MKNITMPLGDICMVNKVDNDFGLISFMFEGILNKNDISRKYI